MRWRRFCQPSFLTGAVNLLLLVAVLVVLLCVPAPTDQQADSGLTSIDVTMKQLQESLNTFSKHIDSETVGLKDALFQLQKSLEGTAAPEPEDDSGFAFHTKSDAEVLIRKLGQTPTATQLAEAVATIDVWIAGEEDQTPLDEYKSQLLSTLRDLVAREVSELHKQALHTESGSKATNLHAKAGQVLALYPMDSSHEVLDRARLLSSRHSEVGSRIEVIRRQRYNAWAMGRIEEAILQVNASASNFKTSDNPRVMEATVDRLGPIDPVLLEPVVAQLYSYALEHAKTSVSSEQQLELGKRLVNPALSRKGYGDF